MMYNVFRQGTHEHPMPCPMLDKPWIFAGECEADNPVDAIRKVCGDEPPEYNKVWYIALDKTLGMPEYYKIGNKEYGKPQRREW